MATATGSTLATGLVFFAALLPNLLLSPIAGTFVDRWDHKEVMVVSDILRAAIMLVIPVAAVTNIVLVYPLIFLAASISVFFRPARVAILPQLVPERDLLSANSALWVGETLADVIGYPLAGIFVALLGELGPDRLLVRQRDLSRVGRAAGHDRRPGTLEVADETPTRARASWPR